MVVGAGSESYRTLRALVERLRVMLAPAWLSTPTQAIGIGDVLRYLVEAPHIAQTRSREIQIGSAEILTYGQMLDEIADALGLRRRHLHLDDPKRRRERGDESLWRSWCEADRYRSLAWRVEARRAVHRNHLTGTHTVVVVAGAGRRHAVGCSGSRRGGNNESASRPQDKGSAR